MPTLVCRNCGTKIRVQGLAALCPQCGFLVQVGENPAANPSTREPSTEDSLLDLLGNQAQVEEAPPAWLVEQNEKHHRKQMLLIGGSISAVVLVLLLLVVAGSWRSAPVPVAIAPPKPARVVPPPPEPVAVEPPTATTVPTTAPLVVVAPPRPHAELKLLKPVRIADASPLSDERIGQAIQRGIDFLYGKFQNGVLPANLMDEDAAEGLHALCLYALLHGGQATGDTRLSVREPGVKAMLAALKKFSMSGGKSIYARSLRVNALAVYDRDEDRQVMDADAAYLIKSSMGGAYTYFKPPAGTKRGEVNWDNSNSQYGALGIWAAAEAGVAIPGAYWNEVENHWLDCQSPEGGWSYVGKGGPSTSMTAAGLTMLFVARSQIAPDAVPTDRAPANVAMQRGLTWLGQANHLKELYPDYPAYSRYGIERVGLASGYKYFGEHDWYLELAADVVNSQGKDGSWAGIDQKSGFYVETAFNVLFLSRGRHPVFMAKLQYDGKWNNRPRDVGQLTDFADRQIERRLNWQIVDLERSWLDWTDSPVLFISGDKPIELSDQHLEKLRNYVRAGGLIFTHADRNQAAFNKFVEELVPRLWPGQSLTPLPDTHPVYSVFAPQSGKNPPPLSGVDNGARLLLIHSPTDFARLWQKKVTSANRAAMETGVNVVIYASGKRDFVNRASSTYIAQPAVPPIGRIPVARVRYDGRWDPEPGSWERFSRWFQLQTSIATEVKPIEPAALTFAVAPFAHLTGVDAITLDDSATAALRTYIDDGGTILIDACGGSKAFSDSVHATLLPKLLGGAQLLPVPDSSRLLSGNLEGTELLVPARVRGFVSETVGKNYPKLQMLRIGKGAIIVSDLDLTSGLLGTNTWSILGYSPTYAQSLMKNALLWTIADKP